MLRVFTFLGALLLAAIGLAMVADTPGQVTIAWDGKTYQMKLLTAAAFVLAFAVAVTLLWSLIRALMNLPGAVAARGGRRQAGRGHAAVSRGLIAIGSGDLKGAERHAREAAGLIGGDPAALLLSAQTAQLAGKREEAEAAFTRMLEKPETKLLGLRGLFIEARRRGDDSAARFFAGEAYKAQPGIAWVSAAALEEACRARDWEAASRIVEQSVSRRVTDKAAGRRQRAVLFAARAVDAESAQPAKALDFAREALRLEPGLVPAAALAGRMLAAQGDVSRAARLVEAAWRISPHPDLASAYVSARPGDSSLERLARARRLEALAPGAQDGRLALALAAASAREFGQAREALKPLIEKNPSAPACLAMAEIEQRDGASEGLAREWLARAARAPRGKAWVADGIVSRDWQPVSPVTGRLDAFQWQDPPEAPLALAGPDFQALEPMVAATLPGKSVPALVEAVTAPLETFAPPPLPDDPGPRRKG